ncbi:LysM peptidoglycan-binding domain-containing protein [Photobacterium minamisatsumaniensis]|uniref:LysM peptidoglycan-binding domain-containing protein n=1 Tax=Photobacterium minamisatsumaniensis TaxID=2910233 RepID=UPI003D0E915D
MLLRVLVFMLACFSFIGGAMSQPLKVIDGAPSVYIVKKGDTLWDISSYFLSNPWLWPQLWQANSYIKNPHLIYPGDRIHLIWVDGQPQLRLKKTVKLSPEIRVIRAPITTIQSTLMLPYLAQDKLLTPESLARLPQITGESRAKGYMEKGDTLWVDTELEQGEEWWVYRPDKPFRRDIENEGVSRVIALKEIAKGTVVEYTEGQSAIELTAFNREVRQNDVLLPAPLASETLEMSFYPSSPPPSSKAVVLGHLNHMNYIATDDAVVIDLGHLDGVAAGNVFQLHREGADVSGRKGEYHYQALNSKTTYSLRNVPIGEIVVVRPYERFSLAVVTKAIEPFSAGVMALPPSND